MLVHRQRKAFSLSSIKRALTGETRRFYMKFITITRLWQSTESLRAAIEPRLGPEPARFAITQAGGASDNKGTRNAPSSTNSATVAMVITDRSSNLTVRCAYSFPSSSRYTFAVYFAGEHRCTGLHLEQITFLKRHAKYKIEAEMVAVEVLIWNSLVRNLVQCFNYLKLKK